MNAKFNKNAKVEKFTTMLGLAVRLIVIDPLCIIIVKKGNNTKHQICRNEKKIWILIYLISPTPLQAQQAKQKTDKVKQGPQGGCV